MNLPPKRYLEVGDDGLNVIVNHPDLQPDENGVGHIVFSPDEARNLARLLLNRAYQMDGGAADLDLIAEARRPVGLSEMIKDGVGDLIPRLADALDRHLTPIPMILHCPQCGTQHVDAPEPEKGWTNPPHKSHLCSGCGEIWRPADVPTVGVMNVATRGSADTWPPIGREGELPDLIVSCAHHRTLFLQGSFGSGGRESVNVCRDCGQFSIFADREGVHFSVRFSLWGCDALIAASQTFRAAIKGESVERLSKRVWKPLDFAGLRLYHVVCTYRLKYEADDRRKHYTVAATAPRDAAAIIEETSKELYDQSPDIEYWAVSGFPLNVLQPLEWTENGISILNEDAQREIDRLKNADRHAFSALEALQLALDSYNEENPWLGITASVALLQSRIEKLESAIKSVVTQQADDLCWMDIYKELATLVGIEFNPEMLPREQMLANCTKYVDSLLSGVEYKPADDLIYVPGDWLCPRCGFRLHRRLLNPVTFAVGISDDQQADPCPNDGTEMQPLTWKQDANEANRVALDLMKQVRRLQERVDELEPRN